MEYGLVYPNGGALLSESKAAEDFSHSTRCEAGGIMGLASIACVSLAAVALYVGMSYLTSYFLSKDRPSQDLTFSLMCFAAMFYDLACAGVYASETPDAAVLWQSHQIVALSALGIFFLWFVSEFTRRQSRWGDAVFSGLFLIGIVLALINPQGWMWTDTPIIRSVSFFGREIIYREMKPGVAREIQSGVMVLALIYIAHALLAHWRAGHREKTRPVLIGFSGLALGLMNDAAISHGLYNFIYTIEYAYMFLIVCMAYSLHRTQVRTDESLKKSEERYRSFLDDFQGIAFRATTDYRPFFFHGAVTRITGYTEEDFLAGTPAWRDLILPEDRARILDSTEALAVAPSCSIEREYRIRCKNGSERWIQELVHTVPQTKSKVARIQGAFYEITDRKKAEDDLKRLAAAVNAAAESIIVTDADHRILYVNPAFEALSGYRRDEMIGKTPALLKSGKHKAEFYRELHETLAAGKVWRGRFINRMKDGSLYEEEAVISPVRDDAGAIVNYVAVKRDVTHETLLESELRQSQKMDAIGKLAGRVAHDFTNILVIIQGNVGLIQDKIPRNPEIDECLESIVEASNRACQLTSQLLAFSHRQALNLRSMDLSKAVRGGADEMLRRAVNENIRVSTHVCKDACTIKGDPDHIEQIIVHLSVNACDAMPSGGVLTIETMRMFLAPEEVAQTCQGTKQEGQDHVSGSFAVLWVSDSGCGIPEDVRRHIFEPFYTTKGGAGVSSGLGLSTVYGIVEQHHGFITVYSEEGKGSAFAVFIPLSGRGRREMEAMEAECAAPTGSERILMIGKADLARSVLGKILKGLGYTVLDAPDIEQAVYLARDSRVSVDLIIADRSATMPKLVAAMNEIKSVHPKMKTLFTSGLPRMHLLETREITSEDTLVYRPYRRRDVALAVRRVLDG